MIPSVSFSGQLTRPRQQVRFGQTAFPEFSERAVRILSESVAPDQARYGKDLDRLLETVSAFTNGSEIVLEHYDQPPIPGQCFRGECGELTYAVGKKLEVFLGSDIALFAVQGQCPEYFSAADSQHMYLIAVPGAQKQAAQAALRLKSFPKGALIVDPSFNRVLTIEQAERDYTLSKPYNLESCAPENFTRLTLQQVKPGKLATPTMPLGYLQDLDPGSGQTGLVFINFTREGEGPVQTQFSLMDSPAADRSRYCPEVTKRIPVLAQLKAKLDSGFLCPPKEQEHDHARYQADLQAKRAQKLAFDAVPASAYQARLGLKTK